MNAETRPEYESWGRSIAWGVAYALAAILLVLLLLAVWVKVDGNLADRSSPPAACQLLGGSWSWWSGWSCS